MNVDLKFNDSSTLVALNFAPGGQKGKSQRYKF